MRLALLAFLVVLAACGGGGDGQASDDGAGGPNDDGTLGVLAFGFVPGDRTEYSVELSQRLTATGTSSLTSEADDEADVTTTATGTISYEIDDGPEDGLVELSIRGDFDTMATEGTFNGRAIETPKDITQFAPEVEAPRASWTLDEQGRPWREEDGPAGLNPLWLLNPRFPAFDPLEDPLGPLFGDEPVVVGEAWTVTDSSFITDQEVTRTHRFTVTDVSDGIATIDYESETSGFTVDFGETVRALLDFLGRGSDDDAGLVIAAAPGTASGVITFDLGRGLVMRQEAVTTYSFDVDASIPLEDFAEADIVLAGQIEFTAELLDGLEG